MSGRPRDAAGSGHSCGIMVGYTSADVAMSIIQNKQVWTRNTTVMNDFKEIEYGESCLVAAYRGAAGVDLKEYLEVLHPGITKQLEYLLSLG